ncbi:acyltransferase-domain-containing protein [Ramaria rubella]|nr:acyltransferase-domain-containing protein [Ramaria rubella]
MTNKSLLSALTIASVGLGSRAFLKFLCANVKVAGLSRLLDELERVRNEKGKGILTVSNHISVVDEPLTWGILPSSHFTRARPMRWSLGASDICFTNPLFSEFFRQGQVLETFRGKGIRQEAVDRAIHLLNEGQWVHIFPEGKIAQPAHSNLRRFKWGVGRMLIEAEELPTILPMWVTGFDQVMNESRGFPRFIPRPGKRISVTFGESSKVQHRIDALRQGRTALRDRGECDDELRATITRAVQEELEVLGAQVSGEVVAGVKEGKEKKE